MEIYKGFYINDTDNYSEEEKKAIRQMHTQLELRSKNYIGSP